MAQTIKRDEALHQRLKKIRLTGAEPLPINNGPAIRREWLQILKKSGELVARAAFTRRLFSALFVKRHAYLALFTMKILRSRKRNREIEFTGNLINKIARQKNLSREDAKHKISKDLDAFFDRLEKTRKVFEVERGKNRNLGDEFADPHHTFGGMHFFLKDGYLRRLREKIKLVPKNK